MKRATMTVAEMVAHVQSLARAFHILLVLDNRLPREMAGAVPDCGKLFDEPRLRGVRGVFASEITDETGYAIVLHELGHLIAANGVLPRALPEYAPSREERRRYANFMFDEEHAAWDWAEHQALIWSAAMESVRRIGLSSYEEEMKKWR